MALQIITKEDLDEFREKLLNDLKELMTKPADTPVKYLKSYQVKNMLKISSATLLTLREKGIICYTKIGGTFYYKQEDIVKMLESKQKSTVRDH
ncbi:helix-turn-helix domain-containing protein [Mucilaginibacter corticis]|uniref:Helix-turn-helix domain-containing protein n=2 Tax=Mucilaginibacter corticis TaxID=2597670 RepID=A0A556MGB3_9SPHI|nr:helix-turn-helix domain-containing protein [Mucilaginibacter corticis]